MDNYRFPKTDSEREAMASQIGADGRTLLTQIDASDALPWLADLPAIKTLRQVWTDHYTDPPEPPRWRGQGSARNGRANRLTLRY